jgi:hypothetical protein
MAQTLTFVTTHFCVCHPSGFHRRLASLGTAQFVDATS